MERLTEYWKKQDTYLADIYDEEEDMGGLSVPPLDSEKVDKIVQRLGEYEQAEEDGLLMLKVWILENACSKPSDCEGDCEFCDGNELDIKETLIKYSDFDKTKHYKSEAEAEQALAENEGE